MTRYDCSVRLESIRTRYDDVFVEEDMSAEAEAEDRFLQDMIKDIDAGEMGMHVSASCREI